MRIAIVGGGLTAAHAIEELRRLGHEDQVDLFGAEEHVPYNRPPLSKGVLLGKEEESSIFVHDEQWYVANAVELHLGDEVSALDLEGKRIVVGSETFGFDQLLISTGSAPRRLADADQNAGSVAYLRTLEDSRALKAAFGPDQRVLIVGAGWIGLEVAAAARTAGSSVSVVESAELPLLRVLGPEVAGIFAELHRSHGVDLRLGTGIDSFMSESSGTSTVRLDDGAGLEADLVVVGIGVTPNDRLASAAGLEVDNGILVDERLRTLDPNVFAAGDVANHLHPVLGRRIRVEHWDTAIEQGKLAAHNLLGAEEPYTRLPYFFTDQYDLGMSLPHISRSEHGDTIVLRPVGEFDLSNLDLLRSTFLEAATPETSRIVIDLSGTTFVDSMAIGTMLGVARRANGWGGWVRLVGPRPNVRRVLHLTGLDKVFAMYDTVDQAVMHVQT